MMMMMIVINNNNTIIIEWKYGGARQLFEEENGIWARNPPMSACYGPGTATSLNIGIMQLLVDDPENWPAMELGIDLLRTESNGKNATNPSRHSNKIVSPCAEWK